LYARGERFIPPIPILQRVREGAPAHAQSAELIDQDLAPANAGDERADVKLADQSAPYPTGKRAQPRGVGRGKMTPARCLRWGLAPART